MPPPKTYTGADLIELHLPGSPALLQMVLKSLLTAGARSAGPGEFTARAFFNGRMDLTQAEAVAELISARSDAQLRAAERLLQGQLHKLCAQLTERIAEICALVEADIDFSDQDLPLASSDQLNQLTGAVHADIDRLLRKSLSWDQLTHLPQVAVAGPANAGKTALTNALLGFERGIVSSIAGTTRDLLTGPITLTLGECLIIDTAGLGAVADPLADQTQQLTRTAIATCDLLCWVVDVTSPTISTDFEHLAQLDKKPPKIILLANKIDLLADPADHLARLARPDSLATAPLLPVSALNGTGIAPVIDRIEDTLHNEIHPCPPDTLALTLRQRQSLTAAADSLANAADLLTDRPAENLELVALELRDALDHLAAITGQLTGDDLLARIFSRFCVGK